MIFIVGAHATGKTHMADILCQHNFAKIDLGPLLRTIHKNSGSSDSFAGWVHRGEEKFGRNFTNDLIVKEIKNIIDIQRSSKTKPVDFIIIGSRSIIGLKYILECIGHYENKDNAIIFLEAPFSVMYERYKKRENLDITAEQFEKILENDRRMGLEDLRQEANFTITNDATREKFSEKIKNLLYEKLNYRLSENLWEPKLGIK